MKLLVASNNVSTFQDPARHCVEYEKTIKTVKDKNAILEKLNNRRNKIAGGELRSLPSAENMMKLEWNKELELSAQRWANQCVKHRAPDISDTCRDLGSMFVGQNIATIYGEAPGLTPQALVDVWYMELLNVNASVIPSYRSSSDAGYSHYEYFTQLVWANSKQVGCGGVKFKERLQDTDMGKNERAIYRVVCNFAPGGNILNQSVYIEGAPCSNCPEGTCDLVYPALCSSTPSTKLHLITEKIVYDPTTAINLISSRHLKVNTPINSTVNFMTIETPPTASTLKSEDDDFKPFDYFSHLHDHVRPPLATSTKKTTSCKDIMVVDEFLELLKKKLSTDPMFKDLVQTSTMNPGNFDNAYTDAMALASRIYSKKVLSTTPKFPEKDYLNSTLLVDLVEAVIFRNGDKIKGTQESVTGIQSELDVSPVKIQAELAEVKRNSEVNGHLFFPEDMEDEDRNTEITELYYDASYPSIPDIELDNMKRNKPTKDFLDEILDSETVKENRGDIFQNNAIVNKRDVATNLDVNSKTNKLKSMQIDNYDNTHEDYIQYRDNMVQANFKKSICNENGIYIIKYKDLLKTLALDLKPLKLNERFHCSRNNSQTCSSPVLLLFILTLLYVYFLK